MEDVALCDLVQSWSEQLEDVIPFSVLLCVSSYTRHTSGCVPVKSGDWVFFYVPCCTDLLIKWIGIIISLAAKQKSTEVIFLSVFLEKGGEIPWSRFLSLCHQTLKEAVWRWDSVMLIELNRLVLLTAGTLFLQSMASDWRDLPKVTVPFCYVPSCSDCGMWSLCRFQLCWSMTCLWTLMSAQAGTIELIISFRM